MNSNQKQQANSTQRQRSQASKATAKQFWNGWVKLGRNDYQNVTDMSIEQLTQFAQQMLSIVEQGRFSKMRLKKSWYNQQLQNRKWPIGSGLIAALNYWTALFELEQRNANVSLIAADGSPSGGSKTNVPLIIGLSVLGLGGLYLFLRRK